MQFLLNTRCCIKETRHIQFNYWHDVKSYQIEYSKINCYVLDPLETLEEGGNEDPLFLEKAMFSDFI